MSMDTVQEPDDLSDVVPDEEELELMCPDLDEMRAQRQERTIAAMKVVIFPTELIFACC